MICRRLVRASRQQRGHDLSMPPLPRPVQRGAARVPARSVDGHSEHQQRPHRREVAVVRSYDQGRGGVRVTGRSMKRNPRRGNLNLLCVAPTLEEKRKDVHFNFLLLQATNST